MTVRDLYRVLALSPKSIDVKIYDEQCNEYDSLYDLEEYEVLYIKDWHAETREPNALEPYNPFNSYLCLSIVIAPPKAEIEYRNTVDEIYNSISHNKMIDKKMKTLTNQEKIQKNVYYTLFEINQRILERNMESCIMSYLRKRKINKKILCDHNCVSCISSWLGEEADDCD